MGKIVDFRHGLRRRLQRARRSKTALPWALIVLLLGAIGMVGYSRFSPTALLQREYFILKAPTILNSEIGIQTITGRASVIDGDTIEIHDTRIRLFGIDAPKSDQSCTARGKTSRCGQQAELALSEKISNQVVECQPKDRDRYGRIVAICEVGGEDVNAWMVAQGWALAYRYYSTDYVNQEERAKTLKIGIWQGEFVPPWEWRRGNSHQRTNFPQSENRPFRPRPSADPLHAFYYRLGDFSGTRYETIAECRQAQQRAGNVGVCMMK